VAKMSHSVDRAHAAGQVQEARRRIVDRIKVLEKLKTDADVFRRIRVPPDIARTALCQRGDLEIAWEHKFFDILADYREGRGLVDGLRRAKNRLVEIASGGPPYRTLRGMKDHEILSLPLGEVWMDDEGNAQRAGRRLYKLFDDGIAEATPLTWRNAANYDIDTIVIAVRTQRGDVEAFRNASVLLSDLLSEPFNARDDFLHFLRVVYRGAGDLAAQFAHERCACLHRANPYGEAERSGWTSGLDSLRPDDQRVQFVDDQEAHSTTAARLRARSAFEDHGRHRGPRAVGRTPTTRIGRRRGMSRRSSRMRPGSPWRMRR
jgi:hypothetical protein